MARLKADPKLEGVVTDLRNTIRDTAKLVRRLCQPESPISTIPAEGGLRAEAFANVMLSYRHLEDARMRLGKVMQQAEGGESHYDREPDESVVQPQEQTNGNASPN